MSVSEICNRQVVHVESSSSILEAVVLMRKYHIGNVVVAENRQGKLYPIGILTDRDIVIEVLANDVALDAVTVGEVMAQSLLTVVDTDTVENVICVMRNRGYRRVPVVDAEGVLVGILSLDDVLELLAEEMGHIAGLIQREQEQESRLRH